MFFKFSKTRRAKSMDLGRPGLSVMTIDPELPTARKFFEISGSDQSVEDTHEARYFRLTLNRAEAMKMHLWLSVELAKPIGSE